MGKLTPFWVEDVTLYKAYLNETLFEGDDPPRAANATSGTLQPAAHRDAPCRHHNQNRRSECCCTRERSSNEDTVNAVQQKEPPPSQKAHTKMESRRETRPEVTSHRTPEARRGPTRLVRVQLTDDCLSPDYFELQLSPGENLRGVFRGESP